MFFASAHKLIRSDGAAAAANVLSLAPEHQQWVLDPQPRSQREEAPGGPLTPATAAGCYLPRHTGGTASPAASSGDAVMADGSDSPEVASLPPLLQHFGPAVLQLISAWTLMLPFLFYPSQHQGPSQILSPR